MAAFAYLKNIFMKKIASFLFLSHLIFYCHFNSQAQSSSSRKKINFDEGWEFHFGYRGRIFSTEKRVHEIAFNLHDHRGKGTFVWEP
jgi:hypothetical protein